MNIKTVAHPSEILYDMVLEAPKDLLQISNYELFKDIILNKKDLTEQNCEFLAKVFQTSKEYWMNMQAQYDKVNSKFRNALNSVVQDIRNMSSEELKAQLKESEKSPLAQVINQFQQDEYIPCPDMSEEAQTEYEAFTYVINTSGVSKIHLKPLSQEFEAQNLYVMTEQAYKYMLSKCTKDELWDMGILGQSEKYVKKVELPKPLQNKIKRYYGNGLECAR